MNSSLRLSLLSITLLLPRLLLAWHHGLVASPMAQRLAPTTSYKPNTRFGPHNNLVFGLSASTATSTALWAQPPPARQPRRKLPKRKRRREKQEEWQESVNQDDELWETAEVRPLISFRSKELGEDYWMDEDEVKREQERLARRPPDPGQIPKQKLWNEVLSPYRQNWIGIMSVIIVVLATLVTKFPELLSTPTITIPDL